MTTATTEIRAMTVDQMQAKAEALTAAHWAEVGEDGPAELAPDWDRYHMLERAGVLLMLGGFVGGVLAGYCTTVRGNHSHDKRELAMYGDAIFVAEQHRRTGLGLALLQRSEDEARDQGVTSVFWNGPEHGPLVRLLDGLHSYQRDGIMFKKRIV